VTTGNTGIGLTERLEQTRLIAFRNPDPGIVDLNFDLYAGVADGALFDQNIDIAMFGELDGIAHQVGDDLLQAQRVANDVIRHIVFDVQRQLQPLIVRGVRQQRHHLIQRIAQQERNALQNQLPASSFEKSSTSLMMASRLFAERSMVVRWSR
jgi:hypothetical protein